MIQDKGDPGCLHQSGQDACETVFSEQKRDRSTAQNWVDTELSSDIKQHFLRRRLKESGLVAHMDLKISYSCLS